MRLWVGTIRSNSQPWSFNPSWLRSVTDCLASSNHRAASSCSDMSNSMPFGVSSCGMLNIERLALVSSANVNMTLAAAAVTPAPVAAIAASAAAYP
mgnify:CR=1 FL=1